MSEYIIHHNNLDIKLNERDLDALDMVLTAPDQYHVLHNQEGFDIKVVQSDFKNKTCTLSVNGTRYTLNISDHYDQMVERMGLLVVEEERVDTITAPIPGLIIDINVAVGDTVAEGDPLLVLSAMKMENIITAPNDGTIASIDMDLNEAVEKGKVLITFE